MTKDKPFECIPLFVNCLMYVLAVNNSCLLFLKKVVKLFGLFFLVFSCFKVGGLIKELIFNILFNYHLLNTPINIIHKVHSFHFLAPQTPLC